MKRSNILLMILSIILAVSAFFLFRILLSGKASQYTSEIAAAFVGSLLTAFITMMMLNKQSEMDMQKDRNAAILGNKLEVYGSLMESLRQMLCKGQITDEDVVTVQILNQRIAFIADEEVVATFQEFARRFASVAKDGDLSVNERDGLLDIAGELSVKIRKDLLSGEELRDFQRREPEFLRLVKTNVESLKTQSITQDGFMELCSPEEKQYFGEVLGNLQDRAIKYFMRTKGMTIQNADGNAVAWCFPTKATRSIQILKDKLPQQKAGLVKEFLSARGIGEEKLTAATVSLKTTDLSASDFCDLLSQIV